MRVTLLNLILLIEVIFRDRIRPCDFGQAFLVLFWGLQENCPQISVFWEAADKRNKVRLTSTGGLDAVCSHFRKSTIVLHICLPPWRRDQLVLWDLLPKQNERILPSIPELAIQLFQKIRGYRIA